MICSVCRDSDCKKEIERFGNEEQRDAWESSRVDARMALGIALMERPDAG